MTASRDVVVLVGSLRKQSWNRKVAIAMAGLAPERLKLEIIEIGQMPFYDEDADAQAPSSWTAQRSHSRAPSNWPI